MWKWFLLSFSRNNWPTLTHFSMEVHLDELQVKFNYLDLHLIFKVMVAILIVVQMVSTPCNRCITHKAALVSHPVTRSQTQFWNIIMGNANCKAHWEVTPDRSNTFFTNGSLKLYLFKLYCSETVGLHCDCRWHVYGLVSWIMIEFEISKIYKYLLRAMYMDMYALIGNICMHDNIELAVANLHWNIPKINVT